MVGQSEYNGNDSKASIGRTFRNRLRHTINVDTEAAEAEHQARNIKDENQTPRTEPPTPSPTSNNVRGQTDIRSPGIDYTPASQEMAQVNLDDDDNETDGKSNLPDFITQTDKFGNASAPRRSHPSDTSQQEYKDVDVDPCDTLLESLRMMCCCLIDSPQVGSEKDSSSSPKKDSNRLPRQPQAVFPSKASGRSVNLVDEHKRHTIKLLPDLHADDKGKKCLVLDLDETLVHSSFRAVPGADFVIPVQIEDVVHFVYVSKRPGVDKFLIEMAKHYEIVIYTASLDKYADPLLDLLDPKKTIRTRLFRESCVYYEGNYVKDLSLLNRDLSQSIIVDNSPASYIFHPENAIDCSSYIDDPRDQELDQIGSFLEGVKDVKDVTRVCGMWRAWPKIPPGIMSSENLNDGAGNDNYNKYNMLRGDTDVANSLRERSPR